MPTALIADDEPNLSAELAARLAPLWPELDIVGMPRNGVDALAELNAKRPDFAFLDIRMPGIDGLRIASLVPHVHVVGATPIYGCGSAAQVSTIHESQEKPEESAVASTCLKRRVSGD